jgi:putative component of toxin-antitoxin plasmid stabilization module/DNA-binding phage protein
VLRFSTGNLGDHKSVGDGVWEARVMFGPGYRIYFGKDARNSCSCCSVATSPLRRRTWPGRRSRGTRIRRANLVARRSEDWNVGLAKDLRDAAFAREFLLASTDEGVDLQLALGKVIRAMGVKEFAAKVGMASPNVLRAINPRHNPTQDTLNRLLKPFKLRLSLAPLPGKTRPNAA